MIIDEFLVSLGVKPDKKAMADVKKGVDAVGKSAKDLDKAGKNAQKSVVELATGLAKFAGVAYTAKEVVEEFFDIAKENRGLYFMSQRVMSSTQSLKGMALAAGNLGSSSEEAFSSLESLAQFLKYNPAGENALQSWGVQTKDVNGNLLETADILKNLGHFFAGQPLAQSKQYANFLGIPDKMFIALMNGDFDKMEERHNQRVKEAGLDTERLAQSSTDLMNNWSMIADYADIYKSKLALAAQSIVNSPFNVKKSDIPELSTSNIKSNVGGYGSFGVGVGKFLGLSLKELTGRATSKDADDFISWAQKERGTSQTDGKATLRSIMAAHGITGDDFAAIAGNLIQESRMNPQQVGDNGTSFGLAQWHAGRATEMEKYFGKPMAQITGAEQAEYLAQDLTSGKYSGVLSSMRGTKRLAEKTALFSKGYENPGDPQIDKRIGYAQQVQATAPVSATVNITVQGGANPHQDGVNAGHGFMSVIRNFIQ